MPAKCANAAPVIVLQPFMFNSRTPRRYMTIVRKIIPLLDVFCFCPREASAPSPEITLDPSLGVAPGHSRHRDSELAADEAQSPSLEGAEVAQHPSQGRMGRLQHREDRLPAPADEANGRADRSCTCLRGPRQNFS